MLILITICFVSKWKKIILNDNTMILIEKVKDDILFQLATRLYEMSANDTL